MLTLPFLFSFLSLVFLFCFPTQLSQPNNVEGEYYTDTDYGTVGGAQTQSPETVTGLSEVNVFFCFHLHFGLLLKKRGKS